MTTGASLLIGASSADPSWDAIDWQTAERSVRRLQMRIAKATQLRRRVRSLALERLERCEGKLSRTVLRGLRLGKRMVYSNLRWLPWQSLASRRVPSLAWGTVTCTAKRRQEERRPKRK